MTIHINISSKNWRKCYMKIEQKEFRGIRYLVYYPKDFDENKKYPVMFHLHGAGSRGDDFKYFEGSPILEILNKGDSALSEGICFFPQCHKDTWFDIFNDVLDLVAFLYDLPYVDKSRFNASGISMGGYGIYQVMMSKPEYFNKAIVCCGGGMYWNAGRMKDIKFRIFHGEDDPVVGVEEAKRMYARLLEVGTDVTLTIYKNTDHNSWDPTYHNYDNLKWLFE